MSSFFIEKAYSASFHSTPFDPDLVNNQGCVIVAQEHYKSGREEIKAVGSLLTTSSGVVLSALTSALHKLRISKESPIRIFSTHTPTIQEAQILINFYNVTDFYFTKELDDLSGVDVLCKQVKTFKVLGDTLVEIT